MADENGSSRLSRANGVELAPEYGEHNSPRVFVLADVVRLGGAAREAEDSAESQLHRGALFGAHDAFSSAAFASAHAFTWSSLSSPFSTAHVQTTSKPLS